ncbi:MAG: aldehyde ferredoxin oxidoreductase family protein [Aminobacterium sp.]|jgi:aldehyde:ferredoxin oxidoreductase|uniref:aldehyde ferredoxin oxidoreductase family protein n=1 Tax=Aminobacterium sp. TaxID=1872491 RepID=UPI001BCFD91B|nr:aldehyde ferredoxin oxidoreductase C-terminal domain-containing protein [Aminobacterium sp.]MDD2207228.1 aldehyde ferredoxin oxidoreductase family protein [Aminobacterium sp.]MDD3426039.1 aldehyde ferredoxin oxidoreductase family protein [Aminobacterium sp.]MDD3707220.1 aldehyde ferredoxin oxidoreductase family protein [Aminobacterium sp.]MDD4229070.1 aldehyde ferredoxin oxidoreductase family protein [Aminobacterium sp.]MDD4551938.1 aldehyde ferredoxin oxidoreductase family protein [Aminoba
MKMQMVHVNLSSKAIETFSVEESIARRYIGGSGLGTYFFFKYSQPEVEPLSPENSLIFMNGPFQGTGIPTSGRHQIISKSPLTGAFGESDAGGTFGYHLLRSGYYGIIIEGEADTPLYLSIRDGEISLCDASSLWGKDSFETEEFLKKEFNAPCGVSCIGPAGEKLALIAGIMHDGSHARAAGRCGLGAVMGSKKLKAIVAGGSYRPDLFDKEEVNALSKEKHLLFSQKLKGMTRFGTAGGVSLAEEYGDLPIKNWQQGSWKPEVSSLTGEAMADTILTENYGCMACPIRCGREVAFDTVAGAGPEYETIGMLGSNCLVNDLKDVARAADLCNRYGLDTISTGSVIAFAMELFDRHIITEEEIGFPLRWGDGKAVIRMVETIGKREGIGAILSLGTRKAAEKIGKGAEHYAIHVKGLELPAHDPRCYKSLATGYATSNRGACHLSGYTYACERNATYPDFGITEVLDRSTDEEKGKLNVPFQNYMGILDSLKICKFPFLATVSINDLLTWIHGITGWEMTREELEEIADRIFTLKRLFNGRCGLTKKDDTLPERILKEPRKTGGAADTLPDLEKQLKEYYSLRGWNEDGLPTYEQLKRLGIEEFLAI